MSEDGSGDYDGWPDPRKSVAHDEAIRVLEAQREALSDIDDKALRTVRVTAILLGVFVASARIAGPRAFHPVPATTGGGCLFLSLFCGVVTYGESKAFVFGPSTEYVERLVVNSFPGTTWDADYLIKQAYWISENHDVIAWNSRLLDVTQVLLLLGIGLIGISLPV